MKRVLFDTNFSICAVDRLSLEQAIDLPGNDFEDNLQVACATLAGLDAILTRDKGGFATTAIQIVSPTELVSRLSQAQE